MARQYLRTMLTPAMRDAQRRAYGRTYPDQGSEDAVDELGADEQAFVGARDSFYLATVGETGWPYVQHRGGPPGFLVVRSPRQLAFADYGGNRQLISSGNLAGNGRVSLLLMDYAARARLKVLGTARVVDARDDPDLAAAVAPPGGHAAPPERVVVVDVLAWDWNCPRHITQRYTSAEVGAATGPLRDRIAELERQLRAVSGGPDPA